jgi:two-component system, OmpR family, phosphate regulon sensor histidine kinase PhoR
VAFRKRRTLHLPITLSVVLMSCNIALMVGWIVLLARYQKWSLLTIGTVVFALMLVGLVFYLVLSIKEVRLHQQQVNFVDSVTHELKTPLASLRLYLETLQMRDLDPKRRAEFYRTMETELLRLESLINHLLEVGRLDALGQQGDPESVAMEPLLRRCAQLAAVNHKCEVDRVFRFDVQPSVVNARLIVLEMIFGNLLENAIKYGGAKPAVEVEVRVADGNRVVTRISDNGAGVPPHLRKKIFQVFYRAGSELERRQKGTGLGLYIVRTLVRMLKGKITVGERAGGPGTAFEVELPGTSEP